MEENQETSERTKSIICPKSPGYWYGSKTGIHSLGCKSRQCEVCQKYWSTRMRIALNYKQSHYEFFGGKIPFLVMTLTFWEYADNKKVWNILRYFWQLLRDEVKSEVLYFKCVEFNQKHTLPHLHFILQGQTFIAHELIRACWKKAQSWGKCSKLAWNVNIQEIEKSMAGYLSKYLTKAGNEKDEIPRPENWKGRYVSYSPGFFPRPIPDMLLLAQWSDQQENADRIERMYVWIDRENRYQEQAVTVSQKDWQEQVETLNLEWNWRDDKLHGQKETIDLFDISLYNVSSEVWAKFEQELTTELQFDFDLTSTL
jgi:hypothetical protein